MTDTTKLDPVIAQSVRDNAESLKALADDIHAHPETGFNEHRACRLQIDMLASWGFKVATPYAGMDTAYRAEFGRGGPSVCLLSEYDALPGIGHGCGHNLICAASMGAAKALADAIVTDKLPGKVVIMGAPAEETVGGKVVMAKRKAFKGLDMAIMAHPSVRTQPWGGATAVNSYAVRFKGHSAHAAANPQAGLNALDAVRLLFNAVDAWRQQLPEDARVHGIITDGGAAPNIIPETAGCFFFLRSESDERLAAMTRRFDDMVRGAALMTGTRADIEPEGMSYKGPWINAALNHAYYDYARALGMKPSWPKRPGRGSTDFCDVSQELPGVHVYFGIARSSVASHSPEFTRAAGSARAAASMLKAAEALANIGRDFLTDEPFRRTVVDEFADRKKAAAASTRRPRRRRAASRAKGAKKA